MAFRESLGTALIHASDVLREEGEVAAARFNRTGEAQVGVLITIPAQLARGMGKLILPRPPESTTEQIELDESAPS